MPAPFTSKWMKFLPEVVGNASAKSDRTPFGTFGTPFTPHMPTHIVENAIKWKRGERQEVDHLSTPEQAAIIRRMIETGAVLILEGEDGVTYRCHQDGVDIPDDIATLPRYELTQPVR